MGLIPTLVGGVEIRERPKRYPNEPSYKRLDFVRTRTERDGYKLVRAVYRGRPEPQYEEDQVQEVETEGPPRLTFQQWHHAASEMQQRQQEQAMRERQRQIQQQQENELRQRIAHQNFMAQQIPPPPPHAPGMHHPGHHPGQHPMMNHGHAQQRGMGQPRVLGNQQPPQIVDITRENGSESSDGEEEIEVRRIRPRRNNRPVYQEDIYSSSEDEQPRSRRSHSRHRRSGSDFGGYYP